MKDFLRIELETLTAIQSSASLYRWFFRAVQAFALLSIAYFLVVLGPWMLYQNRMLGEMGIGMRLACFPVFLGFAQVALAEFALRAVNGKNFSGTLIGLALSVLMIPSWFFLLGGFGFYCFLNKKFQEEYLSDAPTWFQNLLKSTNLQRGSAAVAVPVSEERN